MNASHDHQKLWDLIKDTRFGMFTHHHHDGLLHGHPLTTQNKTLDEDATLYFFVPKDGEIARNLAADDTVHVAYANTSKDSYVSVSGHAALQEDRVRKESLFTPMAKAWFPAGVDDPNLGLLAVRIVAAEFWDVDDSRMVQVFKMMKAAVTGETPRNMAEHKKLNLG